MERHGRKNLLFLCTGNYYRSRFAESFFNSVAAGVCLPWKASSRGLALELGVNNIGPIAKAAGQALEALGVQAVEELTRMPMRLTLTDLKKADHIIALKRSEHLPLLEKNFPLWVERVEFWHIDDAPEALPLIEREVRKLVARLGEAIPGPGLTAGG